MIFLAPTNKNVSNWGSTLPFSILARKFSNKNLEHKKSYSGLNIKISARHPSRAARDGTTNKTKGSLYRSLQ